MRLAERTSRIATSATMAVGAAVDKLRRSGVEVIDFGAGEPYWPTIVEQIKLADATPVAVMTSPTDGFAIHADAILKAVTPRTRGIIINSPCNPTGALISEGEFRKIAEFAAKHDIWLVVDL